MSPKQTGSSSQYCSERGTGCREPATRSQKVMAEGQVEELSTAQSQGLKAELVLPPEIKALA